MFISTYTSRFILCSHLACLMGRSPTQPLDPKLKTLLRQIELSIKEARLLKGLSQAELSAKSKVSSSTINEIEKRHFRDIKLSTLISIANILETNVVSLILPSQIELSENEALKLLKAGETLLEIGKEQLGKIPPNKKPSSK